MHNKCMQFILFSFFSFNDLSKLRCGIDEMIREFVPYQGPGGGLHPTVDKLILPWAGISPLAWNMRPGKLRLACPESSPGKTGNKNRYHLSLSFSFFTGALVLSPAPGEMFDITVQLSDQLLNYITGTIYIEIDHEPAQPPPVLIQLNGIQYSYTDRYYSIYSNSQCYL